MTQDNLMLALLEIQSDFCPADEGKIIKEMDAGNYNACSCSICQLIQNLIIEETQKEQS